MLGAVVELDAITELNMVVEESRLTRELVVSLVLSDSSEELDEERSATRCDGRERSLLVVDVDDRVALLADVADNVAMLTNVSIITSFVSGSTGSNIELDE